MSLIAKDVDPGINWWVSVPPSVYPITVSEVKEHARIDGSSEDSYIQALVYAVTLAAEAFLGRALLEQTFMMTLDVWPDEPLRLPRPPLMSVVKIETLDEDDVPTEYPSTNYYTVIPGSGEGQICVKYASTPPENTVRFHGGYRITWKAGYGATAESVPAPIRQGLISWVARAYEDRVVDDSPPPEAALILNLYRRIVI
jgi:uncharacterized phiE125 gp8 family phage protein